MKLTYADYDDNQFELGRYDTYDDAEKGITEFLKDHNYKSYYTKITTFPHKRVYDVGSWTQFFIVYNSDNAELEGIWDGA